MLVYNCGCMNVCVGVLVVCSQNPQECLRVMKQLLGQLPNPNYATLKFIIAFLVLVTRHEEVNRMNAMALAIVFGSVLFRLVSLAMYGRIFRSRAICGSQLLVTLIFWCRFSD